MARRFIFTYSSLLTQVLQVIWERLYTANTPLERFAKLYGTSNNWLNLWPRKDNLFAKKGQSNGLQKKRDIAEKASCLLKTDNAVVFSEDTEPDTKRKLGLHFEARIHCNK